MSDSNLGKTPITAEVPAGVDVRFDPCFEALQEEIDKLSSPALRETFSWETVAALSETILKEHAKDLLVASYYGVAQVQLKGLEGLDTATAVYADLLETYWDSLYPPLKRMGGRLSAVQWWVEKTEEALEGDISGKGGGGTFPRVPEKIKRIDAFFEAHTAFGISFAGLLKRADMVGPIASEPQIKETGPAPVKPPEPVDVSFDEVALDTGNMARGMASIFKNIKLASRVTREASAHNPQPYRWLRFATWEPVKSLPPSEGGITRIAPPPPQVLTHLQSLKEEEAWEELLSQSEGALYNPQNTFLLSLHHHTADALFHLGKKFTTAHGVVCREVQLFLHRLPGVAALRFSDGTPFASEETLDWLASIDGQGEEGEGEMPEMTSRDSEVAEVVKDARGQAKEPGKLHEAIDALHRKVHGAVSAKEGLQLRLGLIRILMENRCEKIAVPHVDRVFDDIVRFGLIAWEPALALNGLKMIYATMKRVSGKEAGARSAEVLSMIAGISTVEAMRLAGKK